jgi:sugar transferase (PEP-CTERM/EpsH1 system associated)
MTRQQKNLACSSTKVPLVAHIIHRLDIGGLENGLVNIINRMPANRYRHAIICLTTFSDFRLRIERSDVGVFALGKRDGKDPLCYFRLWRLLRRLRPDIVHTRNLPTLDAILVAVAAGVPNRVHGEHGRDMLELQGSNRKYNFLRRLCRPFVDSYIPLSRDLEFWLQNTIAVPKRKIVQIYNGVDIETFRPARKGRDPLPLAGLNREDTVVIGTVGRLAPVKDPVTLVRAFLRLLEYIPDAKRRLRLAMVGDGPLRAQIEDLLVTAGATDKVWLAGARDDVSALLRGLDIFVLPSLAEGISNTILEAMATGLPVVATRVGGTPDLVIEGVTGTIVPPADVAAMADALKMYIERPDLRHKRGRAGRERVEREFDMAKMVRSYQSVYDALLTSDHQSS